jgi:hypothetical protein
LVVQCGLDVVPERGRQIRAAEAFPLWRGGQVGCGPAAAQAGDGLTAKRREAGTVTAVVDALDRLSSIVVGELRQARRQPRRRPKEQKMGGDQLPSWHGESVNIARYR